jgi:threonine aldolase
MREAMAKAEVGDDVLGDDPTVQELESMAAEIVDKEAALFVPSGTMANSIAVKAWTKELDEVIVEERSHTYNFESTHMTFISRVTPRPLPSIRGAMDPGVVERNIRKPNSQTPRTSLICIENTHNRWSGAVVPMENLKSLRNIADKHRIRIHFDGARVFNAALASGHSVKEYAKIGDSLMFCLSKGLSAPVGSVLTGPKDFIDYGRRIRKALGGGMRQAGILAAAGIVSLTEMIDRLKDDHARAKKLALAFAEMPGIDLDPDTIQTNIIIFGFNHQKTSVPELMAKLKDDTILALATESGIRFVTHKDIDDNDIDKTISAFQRFLGC